MIQQFVVTLVANIRRQSLRLAGGASLPRRAGDPGWYDKPRVARLVRPSALRPWSSARSVLVRGSSSLAAEDAAMIAGSPGSVVVAADTCAEWM